MSDLENESDESLNTEDMQELVEVKKEVITGGVERSSPKKEKVKKPKKSETENKSEIENIVIEEKPKKEKKARTQAQIDATKRLVEANKKKREEKLKNKSEIENESEIENKSIKQKEQLKGYTNDLKLEEEKPKKKMGRPKTHTKEVIHKIQEKVIYMIPNSSGGYDEVKNPKPLSKKDLKKLDLEKQAKQDEIEIGKKLIRKKSGAVDNRSKNNRTEKQLENARKLVEFNKKKREEKLKLQKQNLNESIKEQVQDSMIEVVTKPISVIKEERKLKRNIITPEEQKKYEFSKIKSLFC